MLKQKEWIEVIVAKTGCTKKEAKVFYDSVFDSIREQISPEEAVKIQGFGVLKLRKTAAKEQINLITGKPEIVPEHNVITFKPYFEIDPKPEAIEIEDEDVVVAPVEEAPVAEEVAPVEEVVAPVEEAPVEEAPVAEEAPVVEKDGLVWVIDGKECTTCVVRKLLQDKTALSNEDVESALRVVKDNMTKVGKHVCEVKEVEETFDFIIVK